MSSFSTPTMTETGVSPLSGAYQYLLNGELTDIRESWSCEAAGEGEFLVSSERSAGDVVLQVRARIRDGHVLCCDVVWQSGDEHPIASEFLLQDGGLQVKRKQGSAAVEVTQLAAPAEGIFLLSPLMRVYTGPVIARLLEAGGKGTVVVPAIGKPEQTDTLLRPQVSERTAVILEADCTVDLGEGAQSCRLCEYIGDQYQQGTHFWLRSDDLLLRYTWRQTPELEWDVRLVSA